MKKTIQCQSAQFKSKHLIKNPWLSATLGGLLAINSAIAHADPKFDYNNKPHKEYQHDKKDKKNSKDLRKDEHKASKRDDDDPYEKYDKREHKPHSKEVPYGLYKRQENTGKPLPPGWQKKLHKGDILDKDVYDHGKVIRPRDKDGRVVIQVDNKVIRLYEATREIIEILQ